MTRIWREGGTLERIGLVVAAVAIVSNFFDLVDFEALPKTLDKLAISLPLMALAWVMIMGGQQLRFRAEDRKRQEGKRDA